MSNHQVLKQCKLFSALSSGEIGKIADLASEKEYQAGAVMFQATDMAEELFIIAEGRVALQMMSPVAPGMAVTVDVALAGEMVEWSPLVEPHIRDLTATCLQRTRILAINASQLRAVLRDDNTTAKIMKGVALCVASRLGDTRRLLVSERYWPPGLE